MGSYRLLEHTADIGIAARGESWSELLQQLAQGWREIVCGDSPVEPGIVLERSISGEDREELLVNLLNELVFLLETRNFLPAELQIDTSQPGRLLLQLRGERFDPQRHHLEREVKAATYHLLQIIPQQGEWRARVYLDL